MSDSLEAALKSVLREALHEVVADLMNEWRAAAHSPSPLPLPLSESLLLTARETAKRLAISERHLHSLTRSGQLPCVRVGSCVRYNLETVQKWVRESETTDPQASRSDGSAPPSPASIRATRSERKPKRKDSKSRSKVQPVPAVQRTNLPPKPRSNEKAKAQETKTEEWVSPFTRLAIGMGVDRSSLPPLTNGDLMRIAEVDLPTFHGWQYLNKPLPEPALERLKAYCRQFLKE